MNNKENLLNDLIKEITTLKKEVESLHLKINNLNFSLNSFDFNKKRNNCFQTQESNIQTKDELFKVLKDQNLSISIGNNGVQTDRQTDKTHSKLINKKGIDFNYTHTLLKSLDSIKKELRLKFKRLTNQEMVVFSSIYKLEQTMGYANYKLLAETLSLTESSVREYVRKIISKGIPLEKEKQNNKEIYLKISENLRKITTLETLNKLRDL